MVQPRLWLVLSALLVRRVPLVQLVRRDPRAPIRRSLAPLDRKVLLVFRGLPDVLDHRVPPARMGQAPLSLHQASLWRHQMVCLLSALSAPGRIARPSNST